MMFLAVSELNQCHATSVLLLLDKSEDLIVETKNEKTFTLQI